MHARSACAAEFVLTSAGSMSHKHLECRGEKHHKRSLLSGAAPPPSVELALGVTAGGDGPSIPHVNYRPPCLQPQLMAKGRRTWAQHDHWRMHPSASRLGSLSCGIPHAHNGGSKDKAQTIALRAAVRSCSFAECRPADTEGRLGIRIRCSAFATEGEPSSAGFLRTELAQTPSSLPPIKSTESHHTRHVCSHVTATRLGGP